MGMGWDGKYQIDDIVQSFMIFCMNSYSRILEEINRLDIDIDKLRSSSSLIGIQCCENIGRSSGTPRDLLTDNNDNSYS